MVAAVSTVSKRPVAGRTETRGGGWLLGGGGSNDGSESSWQVVNGQGFLGNSVRVLHYATRNWDQFVETSPGV